MSRDEPGRVGLTLGAFSRTIAWYSGLIRETFPLKSSLIHIISKKLRI